MTLFEIKQAINEGKQVHWSNQSYTVVKHINKHTNNVDWFISCSNGHSIGLTWQDAVTMNGKENEFFISEN
jgi:hypothetical protein